VKILAMETKVPGVTAERFTPDIKQAEAARVWALQQADVIREIYFRQDWPGAVLILECASVAVAEETLALLPLVQAGLIAFDIIPLAPYPGFARLFGS
jgi:hypothetical protein